MKNTHRWICAPLLAVMAASLLAGCGGGGGSSTSSTGNGNSGSNGGNGSTGSNSQTSTASIVGVLQDKSTGTLLPGRTVTVQGTSLTGVTDSNGAFSIANVPTVSVTLVVIDAGGTPNGSYSVDISKIGGSPRNLGTISLDVSKGGLAPPGTPTF